MSSTVEEQQGNSLHGNTLAALGRTLTRSVALYFSRPMRMFRPSKVNGWHSLKGLALQHGASLTPQYLSGLVRQHGFMILPRHFVPPMIINTALGTILWTSYTEMSAILEPYTQSELVVATISGAVAGGVQALAAAPAENARLVLEGGKGRDWSHAWKEVFRGTEPATSATRSQNIREFRQVRSWMKEVGEMAGRGWNGLGWGCAKDVCGFSAFFAVFDLTRVLARSAKVSVQRVVGDESHPGDQRHAVRHYLPRVTHGLVIVLGGVIAGLSCELISRPFDVARKAINLDRITHSANGRHAFLAVTRCVEENGILFFFRNPVSATSHVKESDANKTRGRLRLVLRTLARVGPWGVAFLVWGVIWPWLNMTPSLSFMFKLNVRGYTPMTKYMAGKFSSRIHIGVCV